MNESDFEYEHLNYASPYRNVEYNNPKKYTYDNNNTIDQQIKTNPIASRFTKIAFGKQQQQLQSNFGSIIEEERSSQNNDNTTTEMKQKRDLYSKDIGGVSELKYSRPHSEPLAYHDKLPVNSTLRNKILDLFFNW